MSSEKLHLIACEVFRPELEYLIAKTNANAEVVFLEQGLHDVPEKLRQAVQKAIDTVEQKYSPEIIALAYGFCGRGLYDVCGKSSTLIVPKVHDCIPVLLGDGPNAGAADEEHARTYWLSQGWIKYSCLKTITEREHRYKKYIEDYGQDSADYLMSVEDSWKQHYNQACLIYWKDLDSQQLQKDALYIAKDMQLPYTQRKGSSWFLEELLQGGKNEDHFYHIKPKQFLDIDENGAVVIKSLS